MRKPMVKVSSLYRSDFDVSVKRFPSIKDVMEYRSDCDVPVKRFRSTEDVIDSTGVMEYRSDCDVTVKRFRSIEDVMDSTGVMEYRPDCDVTVRRFWSIEDVMNSTVWKVKRKYFRAVDDIMNSTGRHVKENNFRFIVDIMNSSTPIQTVEDGPPVSYKEGNVKRKPFTAKVDKGKEKCLDEERKILEGRIDSFMSAMEKLIEPQRRSTRWEGSVANSVVGVYLTQNVSDNLSSSAFMSLAAKFPAKIDPSLSVKMHPPSLPTLGAQLKHGENDFREAQVDASETKPRGLVGKKQTYDFEALRKETIESPAYKESIQSVKAILDLESLRQADVKEISELIRPRGMDNMLGNRIKAFLNKLMKDHGSMELEWLRHVDPEIAKDYLLGIKGLGPKSVDCVRLLTLRQEAFPVDTNIGRISVRLGWVPIQPLPESLLLHLLEQYPVLENIHKYLWPRLCNLNHQKLYDLHYQMITFGKVFCTKKKPNCNACPLRAECRHFASELSSAKLALSGPEPEQEIEQTDIEDYVPYNSEGTRMININKFTQKWKNYMYIDIEDADILSALVALTPEAGSIPTSKIKNVSRLRTEHQAYELPDDSPLLEGFDKRDSDDTRPYLLCVLNPGETAQSRGTSKIACKSQDKGELCGSNACIDCKCTRESHDLKMRGTILIPYQIALRRMFPLAGTYFQVNEVFADHASSQNPIIFPREWIDERKARKVYFGKTVPTIYEGLEIEEIVRCFLRGHVCVRAFDRTLRVRRPLNKTLHSSPGKGTRKGKMSPAGDGATVQKNKKLISDLPDKLPAKKKRRPSLRLGS